MNHSQPIDCGPTNQLLEARHGRLLVNRNDVYIGRSLLKLGEYSEGELSLLAQTLAPGAVVVEAGANIGAHSIALAKWVGPQGKVICFEPQRLVFQLLCANLALNSLTNTVAHWSGMGEQTGTLRVPNLDSQRELNFGGLSLENTTKGEAVPMVNLDSLGLPRLDLLKADVEGMELQVLRGGAQTLRRCRPLLYLECDRKEKLDGLVQEMASLEYEPFWHLPHMFRPDNYFGCEQDPFGNVISSNIFAVPRERNAVINGLKPVEPGCAPHLP